QKFHEISELTNDARHRLFINYERLPLVLSKLLKHNKSTIEFISKFADWSALELEMDDNEIELSGYTNSGENHKYLNVFKKQRPDDNNLLSLLPNNISSFMILNIGEGNEFKKHYENYLSDLNDIKDYKKNLKIWYNKNIGSQTTIDFFDFTTGEIALVYKQPGFAATSHQIVFTEVSNKKKAIDFFRAHIQKIDTVSKTIKVAGQRYILYPFQSEQFFAHAFGSVFSNVSPTTVCLIENYLVFSESEKAFKNFIIDYHKKGKLKEAEHLQFYTNESNIFIYSNVLRSIPFLNNYLLEKTSDKLKKDKNFWRNISGPGIQFTADSNPVYTAIKIQLKSVTNKNIQAEWECTLDSKPITKPFTVKNHNTGDYEIFVQTESNTIYLISSKGEILWKKIVNGKIISEVFQIDYYKNNKLQLLFNTAKTLYLIDREGNKTDNYPIDFKSPATNGITVIDYDKDKNYRIFFANKNKGVYALDKTGSTLNGWVFDKTQQEVTRPIQYFRNETKDYICFFDQSKLYITNRRGEIRLKPQADFPIAKNTALFFEPKTKTSSPRFVLSDPSGSVYFVYLDSGNVKRMKMKAKSGNHWFNYKDVSGNSYPEFIFTDENKLTVTDRTNKQVFEMKLEKPISQEMNHYQFSNKNHQIGVVTQANNKVYLIKNNGKPGEGFPLAGNTPFSVRRFNNNQHFSLVVGSNNKLLSYRIYR
ncbi:MAG: hypothetical protein U9N85_00885, partial [Bacteroidota bacterium]|nr:hypothetical protein [Bacteroidota bacterium]